MNLSTSNPKRVYLSDLKVLIPTLLISIIGIITLLSTTILPQGGFGDLQIVYKQILFVIVGIILFFIITKIDLSYLKHWQIITGIYILTVLLLLITLLFAPTINNVKRWLVISGVQIQPSEIAKVVVILFTAVILSQKDKYNEWLLFSLSLFLTLPFVLLIYLEPDASMAFLTLLIWFLVAFMGLTNPIRNTIILLTAGCVVGGILLSAITANLLWLLLLIPALIISVFTSYSKNPWRKAVIISLAVAFVVGFGFSTVWSRLLKDYQKNRIVAFFNPEETESDIGFNVNQSRIAIGSGRLFGKGFGNGTQSKRNFLPEHQTDFIFASFAEEFGLVGSLFLMTFYGFLILLCFLMGMSVSENQYFSLLALGIGVKLLLEVFINIGTNTGAIPATGIPLPLMSAGGSITVMSAISLGIVQNIMLNSKGNSQNMGHD
jgi:rod shape determining protein RodA